MTKACKLEDLVRGTEHVSSPPMIFMQINEAINNPRSSIIDIARLISEDQGLTAHLLKLANSPLYGFPSRIETINQAIAILGTQQIRDLALAASVLKLFEGIPKELIDMESFWCHSISCGLIARILSTYRKEPNVERFFVAGIMHDIGRLIMYTRIPELSYESLLKSKSSGELLYKVEREIIGFDHATVGGFLLKEWRLPLSLEEMVRFHHNPLQAMRFPVETSVVHVADIIAHAMQLGSSGESFIPPLDAKAWERIELSPSILSPTLKQVDLQFAETIQMVQMDTET